MTSKRLRIFALAATALAAVAGAPAAALAGVAHQPSVPVRASLRLQTESGTRALVVGQAVPVTIRADFLAGTGVTLNGAPRLTSNGFTLSGVSDKPRQTAVHRDGLPYTELTWNGALTAIQASATAPVVELPVELSYREAPRATASPSDAQDQSNPLSSFFANTPLASDPFFAQMLKNDPFAGFFQDFGGTVHQREVTLRDQLGRVTVSAAPQPAPAGYAGAVGTFHVTSGVSPGPYRVGEPVTLTMRVEGRGSFDRLTTAGVPGTDAVSTYPPRGTFTPGGAPTAGTKVFTQTLVPRRAGSLEVSAVALATFDPVRRRYVTERTRPFTLAVTPAPDGQAATRDEVPAGVAAAGPGPARTPSDGDTMPRSLVPAIREPWLWWTALALIGAAGIASAAATATVRRWAARAAARRDRRRVLARARRRMDAALAARDPVGLFGAARDGLQACLAQAWSVPDHSISAADVERRLGPRGERVRDIFERADRCTYGGAGQPLAADLEQWRQIAARELDALKEVA